MLFEILALASTGLFAGAAAYVTFVEHPARLSCGTAAAIAEFRPSYRRGSVMQASLATLGLVAAVFAGTASRDIRILIAGLLLGSAIPFTLLVILPTNKRLLDPSLNASSAEAAALLSRWGRLHSVRTIAGVLAFALLVFALAG
ncbi:MAG TPA: DUF1772 domain-containing protein [Thermoanaerobaculia bacterium]|jgi:uncharacterized membrane protein|nr:DUF1772 domain-containing protein [Thermoanaerobaculia bacterium]